MALRGLASTLRLAACLRGGASRDLNGLLDCAVHLGLWEGRLVVVSRDSAWGKWPAARAAVVAGGNGSRLQPLTSAFPKVLLPLPEGTVLDHIVGGLRRAGVGEIHLLLGHHAELVRSYATARFSSSGQVMCHEGTSEQGTAGPLRELPEDGAEWVVVNGDVVADIDFRAMIDVHASSSADITILGVAYRTAVPFGVLRLGSDGDVEGIDEKPTFEHLVNGGVYVLGPRARQLLPPAGPCDMTGLIALCVAAGLRVRVFELAHAWFDIGTLTSYEALLRSVDPSAAEVTPLAGNGIRLNVAEQDRQ